MRSSNFEVYSSAGERAARDTLRHFERVRSFFRQTTSMRESPQFLIRVVVFGSRREYQAVRPNEFAAAFYTSGRSREYIVMGDAANGSFPLAVHEYCHLLVRQAGLKLPVWLNEGIAELYSTLEPRGDKIMVGQVIRGRWQALRMDKWVPLETVLTVTHNSPYYNEKDKAGSLYNQAWALTHMLALSDEYRQGMPKLLAEIQAGTPSIHALVKVYGKQISLIEKELQGYLRQESLQAALLDARLDKLAARPDPEPASEFDVQLMLAELSDNQRPPEESQSLYGRLRDENPERPEPWSLLGYTAWRNGNHREAIVDFLQARKRGENNPKVLWDLGRLAATLEPKSAAEALETLLAMQPERNDVRTELAWAQLQFDHPATALKTLWPIRTVQQSEAVRFFEVFAYANYRDGNLVEARKSADRMKQLATGSEDEVRASRLAAFLEAGATAQHRALPSARPPESDAMPDPGKPTVRRTETHGTQGPPVDAVSSGLEVEGLLVGFDCSSKPPALSVEVEGKTRAFLFDKPDHVVINGGKSGPVDLQCGPQRPRRVVLGYERDATKPDSAHGLVRELKFVE